MTSSSSGSSSSVAATAAHELKHLKAQVKNLEAENAELPTLRASFDALVLAHATSKSQRQSIASTLRHELHDARKMAHQHQQACSEVQQLLVRQAECQPFQPRLKSLQTDLWESHLERFDLQQQLGKQDNEVERKTVATEALWDALTDSEEQRRLLMDHLRDARTDLSAALTASKHDRDLFKRERRLFKSELAERHEEMLRRDEHAREEMGALKRRLKVEIQASKLSQVCLLDQMQQVSAEKQHAVSTTRSRDQSIAALQADLASSRADLSHSRSDFSKLEEEYGQLQRDNEWLCSTLEAEREERKADWEAAQGQVDRLDEEKQMQVKRAVKAEEQLGKCQQELVLTQARERDVQDQLQSAESQLGELDALKLAHSQLSTTLSELTARNTLAESDAAALSHINAQLTGHANPQQKILQVAHIRTELADTKRKYAVALAGLEAAKSENKELNDELEALRGVDGYESLGKSSGGGTRIRRPPQTTTHSQGQPVLSDSTNNSHRDAASGQKRSVSENTGSAGASSRYASQSSRLSSADYSTGNSNSKGSRMADSRSSVATNNTTYADGTKVSLAGVASARQFKALMR